MTTSFKIDFFGKLHEEILIHMCPITS